MIKFHNKLGNQPPTTLGIMIMAFEDFSKTASVTALQMLPKNFEDICNNSFEIFSEKAPMNFDWII